MCVAAAIATLASTQATAVILSAGAGGYSPWEGDGGYSIIGSIGFNPFSEFTRLDLEFEYRDLKTKVSLPAGVVKVPVDTYDLRGLFRFVFNPGGLTPYLGFGAGLKLIAVDDRALKAAIPLPASIAATKSYGISGTVMVLVGVEWPLIGESLAIFAEARADYAWEFTDGVSAVLDNKDTGAFTGLGGLRFTF